MAASDSSSVSDHISQEVQKACSRSMTADVTAMHISFHHFVSLFLVASVAVTDMAGRRAWTVVQARTLRADLKQERQGRGRPASPAMRGTASPTTQAGPSVSPVPVRASVEPPRFSQ